MDIEKVLYHLKEAEKELGEFVNVSTNNNDYDHQAYLIAMSSVFDFVHSIKPLSCTSEVIRDDY